ncbi:hypothetical protein [Sphingorhabdus sp. EL138]|uniref:hypothetical protein n=1 Tax=Sphingorhabdus sp. EL138 TaxID=2073156 RepID=UPI0025EC5CF9|nr:hypothetical protein [Sphingorhabdus sp. EL138]
MSNNHLRLVSDSTSGEAEVASYTGNLQPTGIVDAAGRAFYVTTDATTGGGSGGGGASPPAGSDGDDMKTPFVKLKQNVELLNKVVGSAIVIALGTFVGLFFNLDDRIADRFDKADKQVESVVQQVSDLRVEATKQDAKLDRILESVDARKPPTSAQGKQVN